MCLVTTLVGNLQETFVVMSSSAWDLAKFSKSQLISLIYKHTDLYDIYGLSFAI